MREMGSTTAASRMARVGILDQFRCRCGCARKSRHDVCGAWWSTCTIGRTMARSGSCCPMLRSMALWSGDFLGGGLEVESDQDFGGIQFGEVLDGLDHLVGSILAAQAVLKWARQQP